MDESVGRSHACPQTAPGHLAAIAHLFGLDAPDVSTARVLEIGCSAGGNLIPFAAWHPGARAVGIDLSQVRIDEGRKRIAALGLRNVELYQADIAQIDPATLGTFDFVVCHGVYSWVADNVQQAILSALRGALAPEGIGYISYNVYPGWKAKEIVRDAMLLRGGAMTTPQEKVSYARGMIDFLEEVAPDDSVLAKALSDYKAQGHTNDDDLLHEELATFNSPCYLLEMESRSRANGLMYLAEATPHTVRDELRRQGRGAAAERMRPQPGAAGAVSGFRGQPDIPPIAAGSRRARIADPLQPRPQAIPPPPLRRMAATD